MPELKILRVPLAVAGVVDGIAIKKLLRLIEHLPMEDFERIIVTEIIGRRG